MNRRLLLSLALAVAAVLTAAFLLTRKSITLYADGAARPLVTHSLTVGAAVRAAGLTLYPEDELTPPAETPLRAGQAISLTRAVVVRVLADGQTRAVRTRQTAPLAILSSAGLSLAPDDQAWVDGAPLRFGPAPVSAPQSIEVRRAVTITIMSGGASAAWHTAARTVGQAVWEAGLQLFQADQVRPDWQTELQAGLVIQIERARPLSVQADGRRLSTLTRQATVGAALAEAGVALVGLDYSQPAADQPPPADGQVRVVRVREATVVNAAALPFETVYQALADRDIDTVFQAQTGQLGWRESRVQVRLEDDREVGRVETSPIIVQQPVNRVIAYGTRITPQMVDTPDGPLEYWRAYSMYATSYSPARAGVPSTARNYGITASGQRLVKGLVAIDRRLIPFGTRMYVPGYGFAVAADTGGGVKGRWIDLGYDDGNYVSWRQVVTVYFLTPVPAASAITWIIPATAP